MKHHSIRIENLEFHTCDDRLLRPLKHTTGEIVQWGNNSCWTIAYWEKDDDGFNLYFVGSRPFDSKVNSSDFWMLAKLGQEILDNNKEQ